MNKLKNAWFAFADFIKIHAVEVIACAALVISIGSAAVSVAVGIDTASAVRDGLAQDRSGADGEPGQPGESGRDGQDGKSAYGLALDNGFVGSEADWLASLAGADAADGADGQPDADGRDGQDGKSAYELALDNGFVGSESDWLASLAGADGADGREGQPGQVGADGLTPYIGSNGNWWIGETDTGIAAQGQDGATGADGVMWFYGSVNPEDGEFGGDGDYYINISDGDIYYKDFDEWVYLFNIKGQDGLTPCVGGNGNWFIGETDTGIAAQGQDGAAGADGIDGKSAYELALDNGFEGSEADWLASLADSGAGRQAYKKLIENEDYLFHFEKPEDDSGTYYFILYDGSVPYDPDIAFRDGTNEFADYYGDALVLIGDRNFKLSVICAFEISADGHAYQYTLVSTFDILNAFAIIGYEDSEGIWRIYPSDSFRVMISPDIYIDFRCFAEEFITLSGNEPAIAVIELAYYVYSFSGIPLEAAAMGDSALFTLVQY